jgi:hypothetical protein
MLLAKREGGKLFGGYARIVPSYILQCSEAMRNIKTKKNSQIVQVAVFFSSSFPLNFNFFPSVSSSNVNKTKSRSLHPTKKERKKEKK